MMHAFQQSIAHIPLPEKFTYPFYYTPHPLCVLAAEEVKAYLSAQAEWAEELSHGKMFGVLLVQDAQGRVGYLAAFSGNLAGCNHHAFFVPPVYDLLQPDGFFKAEEAEISHVNMQIADLESDSRLKFLKANLCGTESFARQVVARFKGRMKESKNLRDQWRSRLQALPEASQAVLLKESQYQKASFKRLEHEFEAVLERQKAEIAVVEERIRELKSLRKQRSCQLQQRIFEQFQVLNARGEQRSICRIFEDALHKLPPGGSGECALPKLLQHAYLHRYRPLAMAEFWWGDSPKAEIRHHGSFYPSCQEKCRPILQFMLQGLDVEENPLVARRGKEAVEIVFEDEWIAVVNKPAGLLSVPGKEAQVDSLYGCMRHRYPDATGPLVVHRLDMATSGLMLIAKSKEVYLHLQRQFAGREVKKRYIALLDASGLTRQLPATGTIRLPLCLNPFARPLQMVSEAYGKPAVTAYRIIERSGNCLRVCFYPLTGRTHQLRVHAAHPLGLGCPILGDALYGRQPADRLYLHAEYIEFQHPVYGETVCLQKEAPF